MLRRRRRPANVILIHPLRDRQHALRRAVERARDQRLRHRRGALELRPFDLVGLAEVREFVRPAHHPVFRFLGRNGPADADGRHVLRLGDGDSSLAASNAATIRFMTLIPFGLRLARRCWGYGTTGRHERKVREVVRAVPRLPDACCIHAEQLRLMNGDAMARALPRPDLLRAGGFDAARDRGAAARHRRSHGRRDRQALPHLGARDHAASAGAGDAGLIEKRIDRQFRVVRARPEALRPLGSWYERQQRHWSDAFDRLEAVIAAETPKRRKS